MEVISTATKGGQFTQHDHRNHLHGKVIHAIPDVPANGYWGTKALCGTTPGRRGYGWLEDVIAKPTCQKCLKKLAATADY